MKRVFRIMFGLLLVTLAFTKCVPGDFQGDLPNGYKLFKANTIQIAIIPPDRSTKFVEYITQMGIQGSFIFGKVELLPPEVQKRQIDRNEETHPGYFIINTENNSIQSKLARQDWLKKLEDLGFSREPSLRTPASFGNEPIFLTAFKLVGLLITFVFLLLRSEISNWNK